MCRVLAYLGRPVSLEGILFEADSALVRQAHSPRMMSGALNLAGFGLAAWDSRSAAPEEPFTYRVTDLPAFDRNLRELSRKLRPTCALAHVRGVTWSSDAVISPQNLHPFRFPGVPLVLAHNGHLREFSAMRYDLLEHVRPELAAQITGTTDTEWIYALLLSQLADPAARPTTAELVEATLRTLRIVRDVRSRRGINTSSPMNLFMTTGDSLVATRFSFDYGWYPADDALLETDLPFVSLWYTLGERYHECDGEWVMAAYQRPRSLIVASEPLTEDTSTWLEAPEYSLLAVTRTLDGLEIQNVDLDV